MSERLTDIFGIDVFSDAVMIEKLPKKTYMALKKTIENGEDLDPGVAEVVANAMKDWAIEHGATHYTHWFQPMTGVTAEKHDSFLSPTSDGKIIMEFSGKELIKGEPDASSFPSGGLRATFEARGYTAWDCTSPAFLREDALGVTLCIPTAFCSYTGEALDMKTPLLRSMEALSIQAVRILKLFGNTDVTHVNPTVGPEQEYFLVDKTKYLKRDDLIYSGRTLFGAMPPKGQEMEDHYFGCIKERVASFMKELNMELWKMGVTAKTQHNETAPAQHELAPIYSTANIATDHNQLVMECMKRVANRHNLACLLHEKPFAGVNGSGKHNNWSMITDTGVNLLKQGKTPHKNTQFLLFLSAVIKAVDLYGDILRVSAVNPGNDHRLGEDEAPPAIISIFLGSQLEDVLNQVIKNGEATGRDDYVKINVGVHSIPELYKDGADRNRTSPFAFTGDKFEFRMVGSSMSVGTANTVINTIVADVLCDMADELEKAKNFEVAALRLIRKTLSDHIRIIYNGNGYSKEWVEEAEKRGLPNLKSMVDAIPALVTDKAIELFERHKVLSKSELMSRKDVLHDSYAKAINIEAKTMIMMASVQYIPAVIKYTNILAKSINNIKEAMPEANISVQKGLLMESSKLLYEAQTSLQKLRALVQEADTKVILSERAEFFYHKVKPVMAELRGPIDALECIVDKDLWPVPSYGELLYEL
ncbi:MAG: glutamine synthetase type III [Anaerolineaceae bacterium]|nr:MAG: glutamine synthetase type III [Anaerolineaceae bacterium]